MMNCPSHDRTSTDATHVAHKMLQARDKMRTMKLAKNKAASPCTMRRGSRRSIQFREASRVFLVLNMLRNLVDANEEMCTLCPGANNATITMPEKELTRVMNWPVSVSNCTELDKYAKSLEVDSEDCTRVQAIGTICGCPIPTNSCRLCPDGNIMLPEKNLEFLQDDFDGMVPTCGLFDSFLRSIDNNTAKCFEAQLAFSVCGCPIPSTACRYCAEGKNVSDPRGLVSRFRLGLSEWKFGEPTTCEVAESVTYALLTRNSSACQDVQAEGYVCGCAADQYNRRQLVLVWLPRVSAVMSFFGSLYIITDVLKKQLRTTQHYLLLTMSCFDCVASVWWSLTTLPMPEWTNIYGAKGNDATCTAQGFFIQLGFTSPFLNLSLAVYYWFVISYGWKEGRIRHYRWLLFGVPISAGLAYAFAGVPKYAPDVIMCYVPHGPYDGVSKNRLVFLVIPISIVIFFATVITFMIYIKVYHQQQLSSRWRMTCNAHSLRRRVFWQGFWYLMCFYLSWPILVVAVLVDSNINHRYGFLCLAMFMAPIQGFSNFVTYARPRLLRYLNNKCTSSGHGSETTTTTTGVESNYTTAIAEMEESSPVVRVVGSSVEEHPDADKGVST